MQNEKQFCCSKDTFDKSRIQLFLQKPAMKFLHLFFIILSLLLASGADGELSASKFI